MALYWSDKSSGRVIYDSGEEYYPWTTVVRTGVSSIYTVAEKQPDSFYGKFQVDSYGGRVTSQFVADVDVTGHTALEVQYKLWKWVSVKEYADLFFIVGSESDFVVPTIILVGDEEPVDYETITIPINGQTGVQQIFIGSDMDSSSIWYSIFRIKKVTLTGLYNSLNRVR